MRTGLTVSVIGHTALLLACVLGFVSARKLHSVPVESIPVDIVTIGAASETKLGKAKGEVKKEAVLDKVPIREAETPHEAPEKAKPSKTEAALPPPAPEPKPVEPRRVEVRHVEPKPAEPKHMAEAAPEPRPKPPAPKAEPAPEPKKAAAEPQPPKKPAPKPAEHKAAEHKAAEAPKHIAKPVEKPAETRPVAQSHEHGFDTARIAALLNKAAPAPAARPAAPVDNTASLGTATGHGAKLSASEIDALRAKLAECWNIPAGARDADKLVVRVHFSLNQDGSLSGAPELVDATSGPYAQVAIEAAMRAVRQCQPYSMLPAEKYDLWRQITVNFDPREMFGG